MDKEMLEKIKETLDCSIKISAVLFPVIMINKDFANQVGITLEDILYLNKNYYDINEFLKRELKGENK